MIYALADKKREIHYKHIESALAVWEYSEQSALVLFGDAIGDVDADRVLAALRDSENGSLTRTEVSELFNRHKSAGELERILNVLLDAKKVSVTKKREGDSKRAIERWNLVD
jgi:hypothetical protein